MEAPSTGTTQQPTLNQHLQLPPSWQVENAKAMYLDYLYDLYDRANAPVGLRGTYTGLWQQHMRNLTEIDRLSFYLNQ